jgi:hypothetical protein
MRERELPYIAGERKLFLAIYFLPLFFIFFKTPFFWVKVFKIVNLAIVVHKFRVSMAMPLRSFRRGRML